MEAELRKTLKNHQFDSVDEIVSKRMSQIISSGTKPEIKLREIIQVILPTEIDIRINSNLIGKPDIYLPDLKLVIFCDGCFFHGCPKHGHIPEKNSEYWAKKIELNKKRDARTSSKLRKMGVHVWRIWEHYLDDKKQFPKIYNILRKRLSRMQFNYEVNDIIIPEIEWSPGDMY